MGPHLILVLFENRLSSKNNSGLRHCAPKKANSDLSKSGPKMDRIASRPNLFRRYLSYSSSMDVDVESATSHSPSHAYTLFKLSTRLFKWTFESYAISWNSRTSLADRRFSPPANL